MVVTIDHVDFHEVGEEKQNKGVLYYQEFKRAMVLNRTNLRRIIGLHGTETEEWIGKRITLYPSETDFAGRTVPCIRVREKAPTSPTGDTTNPHKPVGDADPGPEVEARPNGTEPESVAQAETTRRERARRNYIDKLSLATTYKACDKEYDYALEDFPSEAHKWVAEQRDARKAAIKASKEKRSSKPEPESTSAPFGSEADLTANFAARLRAGKDVMDTWAEIEADPAFGKLSDWARADLAKQRDEITADREKP
jgi:hypothetical protein